MVYQVLCYTVLILSLIHIYLFDIPYIKRGQVMLTEMGKSYVAQDNLNR